MKLLSADAGNANSIPKTLTDLLAGTGALISGIQSFYTGTETTLGAENKAVKSGRDGHLIWADKDEAIFDPKKTSDLKIGRGRTTQDVVDIVQAYDSNSLVNLSKVAVPVVKKFDSKNYDAVVASKLDKLTEKVSQLETKVVFDFDAMEEYWEIKTRRGNNQKTKIFPLGKN